MHAEILTPEQRALLPLVGSFKRDFGLVGGTAIALHIGHRESIDFDLFTFNEFGNLALQRAIEKIKKIDEIMVDKGGELTFLLGGVKFTFLQYPFQIDYEEEFEGIIRTPTLLTLAAMKAYAIGRRAKWKDYVDMYFILRDFSTVAGISAHAQKIFGDRFNEKIFRSQLSYFEDIDYTESVVFRPGFLVTDEAIRTVLVEHSIS